MGSGLDDDAALSDFEEDEFEAAPVEFVPPVMVTPSIADNLKSALAELEKEKQARLAAVNANLEADSQIKRLKTYVHETIRQRDERTRQYEEALQSKNEVTRHRDEILHQKEELVRQKDEISRQKDEILRARDAAKNEISEVARVLVTQAEKIMSIANRGKAFSALPRFPKATGLVAVALGFSKRMEEVVEEVVKQREEAIKRRDEVANQIEQRNLTIAIEVSELEASITQLKAEVNEKSLELEKTQKQATEAEHVLHERLGKLEQENEEVKKRIDELDSELRSVNSSLSETVQCVNKAKDNLFSVVQEMSNLNGGEGTSNFSLNGVEGSSTEPLTIMQAVLELSDRVCNSWRQSREVMVKDKEDWECQVKLLREEKDSLLSKIIHLEDGPSMSVDPGMQNSVVSTESRGPTDVLSVQETEGVNLPVSSRGSEAANESVSSNQDNSDLTSDGGIEEQKSSGHAGPVESVALLQREMAALERRYSEVVAKNSSWEEEVRFLQQELLRTANSARADMERLKLALAVQGKELSAARAYSSELENDAKDHIETYTKELAAASEEAERWKAAANEEAALGAAVQEDLEMRIKEIETLNEQITELKGMVEEANRKVSSKEQMAFAAIAARNAAERSLQIADERASELRYRVEDMTRALEELEIGRDFRVNGLLEQCWPWLRGRGRPGVNSQGSQPIQGAAEMETLREPWLR